MITTNFCGNMHKYREMRGISFTDLSQMLRRFDIDVSQSTLQRYESGIIKNVPYNTIAALADCFMVTPPMLMGWETARALNEADNNLLDLYNQLDPDDQAEMVDIMKLKLSRKKDATASATKSA